MDVTVAAGAFVLVASSDFPPNSPSRKFFLDVEVAVLVSELVGAAETAGASANTMLLATNRLVAEVANARRRFRTREDIDKPHLDAILLPKLYLSSRDKKTWRFQVIRSFNPFALINPSSFSRFFDK